MKPACLSYCVRECLAVKNPAWLSPRLDFFAMRTALVVLLAAVVAGRGLAAVVPTFPGGGLCDGRPASCKMFTSAQQWRTTMEAMAIQSALSIENEFAKTKAVRSASLLRCGLS